jgi:hypothetical protein
MENARMRNLITLILFLSVSAFGGVSPVLMNQFTTNAAGTTLGLITATSFTSTASGTNIFDYTQFTNGVNAYVSSIDTNTAQINGGSTAIVLNTVYTNANQRSFLVGSLYAICTATLDAGAVIYYTNNGVAQNLSIIAAHHSVTPGTNWIPFTVPLSPNATYRIQTNGIGTCFPTNVFLWRL